MKTIPFLFLGLAFSTHAFGAETPDDAPSESPAAVPEIMVIAPDRPLGAPAATTTKIDIPVMDIPQSIQVVSEELLRDRGLTRISEVIETVSGVHAEASYGANTTFFNIRGFSTSYSLRDGFVAYGYHVPRDIQAIERIEVLKGPSSVLYGASNSLGGYINTVSKRPNALAQTVFALKSGSDGLVRPTLDLNAPLSKEKSLLGRLNLAYEHNDSFRDVVNSDSYSIAPALTWKPDERSALTLLYEYNHIKGDGFDFGLPNLELTPRISRSRYFGTAEDENDGDAHVATLLFDRSFGDGWNWHAGANYTDSRLRSVYSFPDVSANTGGTLVDFFFYPRFIDEAENFAVQNELSGTFTTGGIEHRVLAGVEFTRLDTLFASSDALFFQLDVFDRDFATPLSEGFPASPPTDIETDSIGVYVQDLITLTPQFKLMAGLRRDDFDQTRREEGEKTGDADGNEWSPRVGLIWQPQDTTALYLGWSRSFTIVRGQSDSGQPFDPETGEQYEVGLKQELFERRLGLTLAVFELTRDDVLTRDLESENPFARIQSGEQRSRGFELDVSGSPTPSLRLAASYTYTDAEVTRDNRLPEGDGLPDVPEHAASLWTSYKLPASVPGLGIGGGLFYQGEREAMLANSNFKLDDWLRADAAVYYERGAWALQANAINLFDKKYLTGGSQGAFGQSVFPSQPASLFVTLSYRL